MTTSAKYLFLPWLRQGISSYLSGLTIGARAKVEADLVLNNSLANKISKSISLLGPGDVLGINTQAIVRCEPRQNITDFESNYLAFIEFYEEDLPWRYSTGLPINNRLTPWLTLIVLKDNGEEYTETAQGTRPLPAITVKAPRNHILPLAIDSWAWSHVQIDQAIKIQNNKPDLKELNTVLNQKPNSGVSRIICPRQLESNTAYHAFLIPSFELGRKAGLGEPVALNDPSSVLSWSDTEVGEKPYPYYYRWFFRTGDGGDFESLARLLRPKDMDKKVGIRDMNIQSPGLGIDSILTPNPPIIGLEGALMAPSSKKNPILPIIQISEFPKKLEPIINQPLRILEANINEDPVISPPLYGQWHARINSLNLDLLKQNWFHELNQDPRYRVAAGMGTQVIQKNQETYMRIAWDQIGEVLEANQKLRLAKLSMHTTEQLFNKHILPLSSEVHISILGRLAPKVMIGNRTLLHHLQQSLLQKHITQGAFRKITRSRGPVMLRYKGDLNKISLVRKLNDTELAKKLIKRNIPEVLTLPKDIQKNIDVSINALVNHTERNAEIVIYTRTIPTDVNRPPITQKVDVGRFKAALENFHAVIRKKSISTPLPKTLDINQSVNQLNKSIDPRVSFPEFIKQKIDTGQKNSGQGLDPIMAYPDFNQAMYQPLAAIHEEYFIPNLHLISNNSISLMVPNAQFIESYMTGLNHEMMRELLWREYPTDQRGTPFRQFWEPVLTEAQRALLPKDREERAKDIRPIHQWRTQGVPPLMLGVHGNKVSTENDPQVVLAIKGDLLKRYPNTIIYAQKATWHSNPANIRLVLDQSAGIQSENASIKHPLFKAQIDPDIHFIGFDLSLSEVKGDIKEETVAEKQRLGHQKLGWFFILQEVPGEPRFGLDQEVAQNNDGTKWENFSWKHLDPESKIISVSRPLQIIPAGSNPDQVNWNSNAADLAYILFQKPIMVAFHAREMLRDLKTSPI